MQNTGRLYACQRCRTQVVICSRCDRGQRYCGSACAQHARAASLRRAAKKHQSSRAGRFNNAARQRRFRQRQQQKVTHHGSLTLVFRDVLKSKPDRRQIVQKPMSIDDTLFCYRCGGACQPFLRRNFLQSRQSRRSFRRQPMVGMAKD